MKEKPTQYELQLIEEINKETPKKVKKNVFSNLLDNVNDSFNKATNWLNAVPGIETIMNQVQDRTVSLFQDLSNWKFSTKPVMDMYAKAGLPQVKSTQDVGDLTLDDVEQIVGTLRKKYQVLAENSAEDDSEASDIVALITLNQQAISEYATAYGFDINLEQERIFALNIMEYAATEDEATREAVLGRMMSMAREIAKNTEKGGKSKASFIDTLKTLSSSVTIRLLKAKVGEVIPLAGAVIGGGFNAYFTHEVSDVAQLIYRQRFLLEKYGEEVFNLEENNKKEEGKKK